MEREDAQRVFDEAEYWRLLLDDLLTLNRNVSAIADDVLDAATSFVTLGILVTDRGRSQADSGLVSCHKAQEGVAAVQASIMRILELARGRALALQVTVNGGAEQ